MNRQVTNGLTTKAVPQHYSSTCRAISCLCVFVHAIPLTQKALPHLPHKIPTQASKIHIKAIAPIPRAESLFLVGLPQHLTVLLLPPRTLRLTSDPDELHANSPPRAPLISAQLRGPEASDRVLLIFRSPSSPWQYLTQRCAQ